MKTKTSSLKTWLPFLILASLIFTGCAVEQAEIQELIAPVVETEIALLATATPTETPVPPTATPTATALPSETPSATATQPPTATLTPTWAYNEAGEVTAPILLYHHVSGEVAETRYHVSVPDFKAQMAVIKDLGYTPIPISVFLEALINGAELPEKPIVITFDDGHLSVYQNAFPVMQEYGFPGVFYILPTRLNAENFVTPEILAEMQAAGWEIGSHGKSHVDLTINHDIAEDEIRGSKIELQKELDLADIQTFAYPFGMIDKYSADKAYAAGYDAAMGLGKRITHTWGNLYYLERIEVYGDYTLEEFQARITP